VNEEALWTLLILRLVWTLLILRLVWIALKVSKQTSLSLV